MKTIYIDFDDVLCETAQAIIHLVKKHFDIDSHFDHITDFDLKKSFNLTNEQFHDLIHFIHDPEIIYNIKPIQGAVAAVTQLKNKGHQICIMTGRPPSTKQGSLQWLHDYHVPYDNLKFVDKYSRFICHLDVNDSITLEELKKMPFDFAIEDSADMALFLSTEMNLPVLLHDRPWNRHIENNINYDDTKISRCKNWDEIVSKIV